MSTKNICLYHDDCIDGYTSAWIVYNALGRDVLLQATTYEDVWNLSLRANVVERNVYIVDFCYPIEVMIEIINIAKSVTVIDHHIGMEDVMVKMKEMKRKDVKVIYGPSEEGHCGATLTWGHFFPQKEAPLAITYIKDYDLGLNELLDTHSINASIAVTPKTIDAWTGMMNVGLSALAMEGRGIRMMIQKMVNTRVKDGFRWGFVGQQEVGAINAPREIRNEIAQRMWRTYGSDIICLIWEVNKDKIQCSLRSKEQDVCKIAKKYGGGGHEHAAGFSLTFKDAKEVLCIDINHGLYL